MAPKQQKKKNYKYEDAFGILVSAVLEALATGKTVEVEDFEGTWWATLPLEVVLHRRGGYACGPHTIRLSPGATNSAVSRAVHEMLGGYDVGSDVDLHKVRQGALTQSVELTVRQGVDDPVRKLTLTLSDVRFERSGRSEEGMNLYVVPIAYEIKTHT